MKRKLIVATKNNGKLKEIKDILSDFDFEVISMLDAGIDKNIEEYGKTFEENAYIKAKALFDMVHEIVIADDSGLEVDYLNKAPGIYSARFAGENASDADRNNKLLSLLENVPFSKRTARFVCAVSVILSPNESFIVRGTCEGYISTSPLGENGFGYDPLFFVPEFNMTTAQMSPQDKHKISHRGKALTLMANTLKKYFII